ncbi:AraC family transcriptional regulator [Aquibaculum arenosum]|uniref:Helix-turn-helix transcriptional regulator n=1 Tax=Aquibaculum arenosum TaxID=3032591 RepID=A0ABT5YQ90_9PROT|nr:helix-turn-helix transcriptional regulator [Fodinicurvata sp. CAU 1616]MDF2097064.1 helix-turn-helix transcriptional regulator [Fodinicurvata sp. CAU 1616]
MNGQIAPDYPQTRAALQRLISDSPGPVQPYARDYPAGWDTGLHSHRRAQLVFATSGVMTVSTRSGLWVVPPQRAVWVPAGEGHALKMHRPVQLRTLYLDESIAADRPRRPQVLSVTPLLRALVLRLMDLPAEATREGPGARLVAVLLDELRRGAEAPMHLPEPQHPSLCRICSALREQPADRRELADWGRLVGASPRTLARRFQAETGMGFAAWRQQARLLAALPLLAQGQAVTSVALDVGYDGPSAFIAAFRRSFGVTPGRYFAKDSVSAGEAGAS